VRKRRWGRTESCWDFDEARGLRLDSMKVEGSRSPFTLNAFYKVAAGPQNFSNTPTDARLGCNGAAHPGCVASPAQPAAFSCAMLIRAICAPICVVSTPFGRANPL